MMEVQKRVRHRSKICAMYRPSGKQVRLGRSGRRGGSVSHQPRGLPKWPTVPRRSRVGQKKPRAKLGTDLEFVQTQILLEAKDQLEVRKATGAPKMRITLFDGSSMGTIQKVLEQDIGMHDVFVGVEHLQKGYELQESLDKVGKKAFR